MRLPFFGFSRLSRCFTAVALLWFSQASLAQGRIVEAVDTTEGESHVDVIVVFSCTMRYLGHDPSSRGEVVRIRFRPSPDCNDGANQLAPERPTIGDTTVLSSLSLEPFFADELVLSVEWRQAEQFVLAPSADSSGLRIRVLRSAKKDASRVVISEEAGAAFRYAVNLDASREPFDEATWERVRAQFGAAVYESVVELYGTKWHRLRIGPFATRADAERALAAARATYPRAWLARGDEANGEREPVDAVAMPTRTNPTVAKLDEQEIARLIDEARAAMRRRELGQAIAALTRVVEQPEHPRRAEALEMLGLARERNRQLAHAKAEYEEYLRLYPQAKQAGRVRQRVRALRSALRRGPDGRIVLDETQPLSPWRTYGGFGVRYQRDTNRVETTEQSLGFVAQNAAMADIDLVSRRKGERFDFLGRASAGYQQDLLSDGPGNRTRISVAYSELADRDRGWSARFGRQSRGIGGLIGAFDGLQLGYQWSPRLRVNALYGYPVASSYDGLESERSLMGLSFDLGTFADAWDFSVYAAEQRAGDIMERRAIGVESRYFTPGRSVVGLIDYDVSFSALNSALVIGSLELPARWTMSFNIDHRSTPLLTTRNALIGQAFESLEALSALFTEEELRRIAEERTGESDVYGLSFSHPLTERLHFTVDATAMRLSETPASAGVAEIEASNSTSYSVQLIGGGWIASRDFNVLAMRYQTADAASMVSAAWYTRYPVGERWRLGPRLRIDRQQIEADRSTALRYAPSLRLDFLGRRAFVLLEAGTEISSRDLSDDTQDTTRYFISAEYRWAFR